MKKTVCILYGVLLIALLPACSAPEETDEEPSVVSEPEALYTYSEIFNSYHKKLATEAYSILNQALDQVDFSYRLLGMNFPSGDIILSLTSGFFSGEEAAKAPFVTFSCTELSYKEDSPHKASMSGKTLGEDTFLLTVEFDPYDGTAQSTYYKNGILIEETSLFVSSVKWAKIYWGANGKVVEALYDGEDVYLSWETAGEIPLYTLLHHADLAKSSAFAKELSGGYLQYEHGEISAG